MKLFYESKDYSVQSFEAVHMGFPEHLHDHVEILLVMEGSIVVRIMDKSRELGAGDCAVIFPQQIHSYHTPAESRARLFIFDDALTGRYLHAVRKCSPAQPFLSAGELPEDGVLALDRLYGLSSSKRERQAERFTGAGNSAVDESPAIDENTGTNSAVPGAAAVLVVSSAGKTAGTQEVPTLSVEELCAAWIQVLFALIWHRLSPEKRSKSEGMELTCQVVQYVMEHFQEPLTLEILARELHVNKYYISHIFSDRLHIHFRRYLNHIRLEYAMELMKAEDTPLIDICVEAGFNSQRSFNRAFMEIMGMTPMEYRKAVAGKK